MLPRTARPIAFDAQGTCELCRAVPGAAVPGAEPSAAERVEALVSGIRQAGRGHPFDCLVGLSGGRDSSYLLYLLVRKHHLRCLAAYYRTPFTSDVIDANVRRLVGRLEVPLVEMDIDPQAHRRVARELVLLWGKKPDAVLANLACAPCKDVNRELFRIAARHKIRTIVAGANVFEAVQVAAGQSRTTTVIPGRGAARQLGLFTQVQKMLMVMRRGVSLLRAYPGLWRYLPLGIRSSVMYIGPHTPYLRLAYPRIQSVEYFYHANWDEASGRAALDEMGWELPPGYFSTWKADCTFAELKNWMFRQTVGMTYMEGMLSNMVRAGVMSRDEALHRLSVEGEVCRVRLDDACQVLELPEGLVRG